MEQYPPVPEQQSPAPNGAGKNKLGALSFLEVGIFEIFFVLVTLAIFFGVMNYFNILPISQIWPNQLGFLPHRESKSQMLSKLNSQLTPTPIPLIINQQNATQVLSSLISSSIKPGYRPKNLNLKHGLVNQSPLTQGSFHADWEQKNATGAAMITLLPSKTSIDNIRIGFLTPRISFEITQDTAKNIYSQYFYLSTNGVWKCKSSTNGKVGIYCENFWETNDKVKTFAYIRNPSVDSVDTSSVVLCQIFPSSNLYTWNSCNPEFAQTGVQ